MRADLDHLEIPPIPASTSSSPSQGLPVQIVAAAFLSTTTRLSTTSSTTRSSAKVAVPTTKAITSSKATTTSHPSTAIVVTTSRPLTTAVSGHPTTTVSGHPATPANSTLHVPPPKTVTSTTTSLAMVPPSSTRAVPSSPKAIGTTSPRSASNHTLPVYVPVLASIFSVLGAGIFAFLIFLICRRHRKKQAVMHHHELQKKARWASRWRLRGQAAGAGVSRRATILSFMTPAPDGSPVALERRNVLGSPVSPVSPPTRAPFRFTTYRFSFAVKMPARFRVQPKKKVKKSARIASLQREFILPAAPQPTYDRRSPPSDSGRTAQTIPTVFSRPSVRSRPTDTTPPAYVPPSKDAIVRNLGSLRNNVPPLPVVRPASDEQNEDTPASTPGPYQPIPSVVPTPLSQILMIPIQDLPLPRMMVVVSTFTPALSDELRITVGETVRLLEEYDDGWCLVERIQGYIDHGAVPRFCLDELPNGDPATESPFARSPGLPGPLPSPTRSHSLRRRTNSRLKGNYI